MKWDKKESQNATSHLINFSSRACVLFKYEFEHFFWLKKPSSEIIFLYWLTCSQKMHMMSGWFLPSPPLPEKKRKRDNENYLYKKEREM